MEQYAIVNANQIMLNIRDSNLEHDNISRKSKYGGNINMRISHIVMYGRFFMLTFMVILLELRRTDEEY